MPIKRLPGVYYDENVSYELNGEGSKIPIFIGVTGNSAVYNFVSYDDANKTNEWGNGTVKRTGVTFGDYIQVEVLSNSADTEEQTFTGLTFFITKNAESGTGEVYELFTLDNEQLQSANIFVTIEEDAVLNSSRYDGSTPVKYTKYKEINTPLEDGGLGQEDADGVVPEGNELMATIKEFYEESKLLNSSDVGVPHIYVIDVGLGDDYNAWTTALIKAKTLLDAQVEVPVGGYMKEFTKTVTTGTTETEVTTRAPVLCLRRNDITGIKENDKYTKILVGSEEESTEGMYIDENGIPLDRYVTIPEFLSTIYNGQNADGEYGLIESAKNLDLRYAFITVKDATDSELKAITSEFNESRVGLCEPLLFGKTISRICCTPNNTEPGYFTYRSVKEDTFIPRTKKEMLDLQDAGIIFNRDEHINGQVYPKINLCVATSFVDNPRPADALFHARFNADNLLREVFQASYEFVKANETGTNIAYLQTKINKLVNDKVVSDEMVRWNESTEEGTRLRVNQSEKDPYAIEISGQLQPVKCTIAIDVTAELRI